MAISWADLVSGLVRLSNEWNSAAGTIPVTVSVQVNISDMPVEGGGLASSDPRESMRAFARLNSPHPERESLTDEVDDVSWFDAMTGQPEEASDGDDSATEG